MKSKMKVIIQKRNNSNKIQVTKYFLACSVSFFFNVLISIFNFFIVFLLTFLQC